MLKGLVGQAGHTGTPYRGCPCPSRPVWCPVGQCPVLSRPVPCPILVSEVHLTAQKGEFEKKDTHASQLPKVTLFLMAVSNLAQADYQSARHY